VSDKRHPMPRLPDDMSVGWCNGIPLLYFTMNDSPVYSYTPTQQNFPRRKVSQRFTR